MLESVKPLVFIRAERNKGYSEKSKKDYDFANITLSDGLESLKVDIQPELVEQCQTLYKKGDNVVITVDITEVNNRARFIVTKIKKAS
ncbi:hypothetical protein MHB42_20600 [Lysinibacillus sp. FSL K6-0232]|uniref:hypothetical protein n=1 Tax=Lysinibacillus sp. FSL K6-0232 TaxID=2921425 RepID=UPI0030F81A3C